MPIKFQVKLFGCVFMSCVQARQLISLVLSRSAAQTEQNYKVILGSRTWAKPFSQFTLYMQSWWSAFPTYSCVSLCSKCILSPRHYSYISMSPNRLLRHSWPIVASACIAGRYHWKAITWCRWMAHLCNVDHRQISESSERTCWNLDLPEDPGPEFATNIRLVFDPLDVTPQPCFSIVQGKLTSGDLLTTYKQTIVNHPLLLYQTFKAIVSSN